MLRRLAILALLVSSTIVAVAQNDGILVVGKDTVAYKYTPINVAPQNVNRGGGRFARFLADSGTDQSFEKRVDMAFVPAIYYSPATSAGMALMAAGLYRLDKENRNISPSNFSVYASASLTGFHRVGVKGTNIFRNDNQRIIYNVEYYSQPISFWGVGYDAAMSNDALRYNASRVMVDFRFLQRAAKGLYVGVGADYDYHFGKLGGSKYSSASDFKEKLGVERLNYKALGLSLFVEFDMRDAIVNPQRGVYVSVQAKVRPKATSDVGSTLWGGRLSANFYQKLWKGAVLALDLRGELNSKGTPWVYNALLGGLYSMRGYYAGRFNDLCAITLQAEIRQDLYRGFGLAAWGGAGNVFSTFKAFDWGKTIPTYGLGLRYAINSNLRLRLDYGFGSRDHRGKLIHGAVFSINEAF